MTHFLNEWRNTRETSRAVEDTGELFQERQVLERMTEDILKIQCRGYLKGWQKIFKRSNGVVSDLDWFSITSRSIPSRKKNIKKEVFLLTPVSSECVGHCHQAMWRCVVLAVICGADGSRLWLVRGNKLPHHTCTCTQPHTRQSTFNQGLNRDLTKTLPRIVGKQVLC